ncbi:MAG: dehydrogenase [Planctomycetaceae bacterium]|nr:dehydrogenase [Planctomycetaceae bacterium]
MMRRQTIAGPVSLGLILVFVTVSLEAAEVESNGHTFNLPDGFEIELVAGPPLVNRPISADFDEEGRLYVTDSSGSNEHVKIQAEKKPHRIVRLEDADGDGVFDTSVVFADEMAFPEGALWHDGSLYVAAPPEIWKLTDTDDDGIADLREVWFDGKTITHCANDLHGPYLGPDGWLYWCKGAFAEQTYERPEKKPLVTRAAHMFRRRPEGGVIESVMTGGMDNPVDVVFTPGGERIFTTTFLQSPRDGKRDGLIHAIYGGVYGKQHGVLEGHPRTGELMPVLSHLGAAAPCGLVRLETSELGEGYQDNLLACLFNMHKITRHVLTPRGGSFESHDEDFLTSNKLDFHPTDVFEDGDGSILVVDTGGWYKLCCPTSQLYKPDILGAIYRVRRQGSHRLNDPRGRDIPWDKLGAAQLVGFLDDERPVVRRRAEAALVRQGSNAVPALAAVSKNSVDARTRIHAVWTLTRIDDAQARSAVRVALYDPHELVRQAAAHSISVWRDGESVAALAMLLKDPSLHNRRVAAEALGRIGDSGSIAALLTATGQCRERAVEHSLIFSLIELADAKLTRRGLQSENPKTRRAVLVALDQMEGGGVSAEQIAPLLSSTEPVLNETAWWLAKRHPEWAATMSDYFRGQIAADQSATEKLRLAERLANFAHDRSIQEVMAGGLRKDSVARETKLAILDAMAASGLKQVPPPWTEELLQLMSPETPEVLGKTVSTVHALSESQPNERLARRLHELGASENLPVELRLEALAAVGVRPAKAPKTLELEPEVLRFSCGCLSVDKSVRVRSLATDVLLAARLAPAELKFIAGSIISTGPMELRRLLPLLVASRNRDVGIALVAALNRCDAAGSLNPEELGTQLAKFGDSVSREAEPLVMKIIQQNKDKINRLEMVLGLLDTADPRRGQQLFHNSKTACAACHQMGYLGGQTGPDLTRIGRIRSERDLLESVMFPNVSFVRSYEPVTIVTTNGRVFTGVVRDETQTEVILQLDAQKQARIAHEDIEERAPGKVSIMPAGLDEQLSPQQLVDLIKFMKVSQ